MQCLWVPGQLPGLNEIIRARSRGSVQRGGKWWDEYKEMKKRMHTHIATAIFHQRIKNEAFACFTYLCVEPHRKRDPSNVLGGAMKFIEDSLKECRKIDNDGPDQVHGICGYHHVEKDKPGVFLIMHPTEVMQREAALAIYTFR